MTNAAPAAKYDVFISYKRLTASAEARLLYSNLEKHGLRVFMDVTGLGSGFFDIALLHRIAETRNFILILAPHALDRCADKDDWLRKELRQALASGCNIIPIRLPGFKSPKNLPDDIRDLPRLQAIDYSHQFFDAMMDQLVSMLDTPAGVGPVRRASDHSPAVPGSRIGQKTVWSVLAGLLLVVGASVGLLQYERKKATDAQIVSLMNAVDKDYHKAVPDTAAVQSEIDSIQRLDPSNGLALYYQGELKRLSKPELFKGGCVLATKNLSGRPGELDAYEDDFRRYLDVASGLPASETSGPPNVNLCYSRPSGFCPQRTAWISQLLANDFYQEALLQTDRSTQVDLLNRAHDDAKQALDLYVDEHGKHGFSQCIPTELLLSKIQELLPPAAK